MGKSGVYKITNKINRKFYIGSSVNIHKRWISHKCDLNKKRHVNKYLQHVNNKYGFECFLFEVIEYCDIELLQDKEQYYIDSLKPEYNLFKTAYSVKGENHPMYGRTHSEEAKLKIKKARSNQIIKHSKDTRRKISESNKGKKVDMNHIKKMVQARKGTNWNKGLSKENPSMLFLSQKMRKRISGCSCLEIINDYCSGCSINEISIKRKISWDICKRTLVESNIKIRSISQQKKIKDERRIEKNN